MASNTKKFKLNYELRDCNGNICKNPNVQIDDATALANGVSINCAPKNGKIEGSYYVEDDRDLSGVCIPVSLQCEDCVGEILHTEICLCANNSDCGECQNCVGGLCEDICPDKECVNDKCVDCADDLDCPENQICDGNGNCVCPQGTFLGEDGRTCVQCNENTDLEPCEICVEGEIVIKDCADGYCNPITGECDSCLNAGNCGENQICVDGECECAPGYVKDLSTGECVLAPECVFDGDCGGSCDTCVNNNCVSSCPSGTVCDGNGNCIPECDCESGPCDDTRACVPVEGGKCGCIDCATLSCSEEGTAGGCQSGSDKYCYCDNEGDCAPNPCKDVTCNNGLDCGEGCGCLNGQCIPCDSLACAGAFSCGDALGCTCDSGSCTDDPDPCSNYSCDETTGAAACTGGSDSRPDCGCDGNGDCVQQPCEGEFTLEKDDAECRLVATLETNKCCDCPDYTVDNKLVTVSSDGFTCTVDSLFEVRKGDTSVVGGIDTLSLVDDVSKSDILYNEEPLSGRVDVYVIYTLRTTNPATGEVTITTDTVKVEEIQIGDAASYSHNYQIETINSTNYGPTTEITDIRLEYRLAANINFPNNCTYPAEYILFSYNVIDGEFETALQADQDFWRKRLLNKSAGQCAYPTFRWVKALRGTNDYTDFRELYVAPTNGVYTDYIDNPKENPFGGLEGNTSDDNHGELWSGYKYRVYTDCGCDTEAVLEECNGIAAFCDVDTPTIEVLNCGTAFRFLEDVTTSCSPNFSLNETFDGTYPSTAQVTYQLIVNGNVIEINPGESETTALAPSTSEQRIYSTTETIFLDEGEILESLIIRNTHSNCCDIEVPIPPFTIDEIPTFDEVCEISRVGINYTTGLNAATVSFETLGGAEFAESLLEGDTYWFDFTTLDSLGVLDDTTGRYTFYAVYTFADSGCVIREEKQLNSVCCPQVELKSNFQYFSCQSSHIDFNAWTCIDGVDTDVFGLYELELNDSNGVFATLVVDYQGQILGMPPGNTLGAPVLDYPTSNQFTTGSVNATYSFYPETTGGSPRLRVWVPTTDTSGNEIEWTSVNLTFTPTNCTNSAMITKQVEVEPLPGITLPSQNIEVCGGSTNLNFVLPTEFAGNGAVISYTLSNNPGVIQTATEVGGIIAIPVTGDDEVVQVNVVSVDYTTEPSGDCIPTLAGVDPFTVTFLEDIDLNITVDIPNDYCLDNPEELQFTLTGNGTTGIVNIDYTLDGVAQPTIGVSTDGYIFTTPGVYNILSANATFVDCVGQTQNANITLQGATTFEVFENDTLEVTPIDITGDDNTCSVELQIVSNNTINFIFNPAFTSQNGNIYTWADQPTGTVIQIDTDGVCPESELYTINCACPTIVAPSTTATNVSYCQGSGPVSITATPSTGNTILWSTGAVTNTIQVSAGTYTAYSADSNGCQSEGLDFTVTENANPIISSVTLGDLCTNGGTLTWDIAATVPPGLSNVLIEVGGQTVNASTLTGNQTVNLAVGTYTANITITDNNGCTASSTTNLDVIECCNCNISLQANGCDITVTDNNGCTTSGSWVLTDSSLNTVASGTGVFPTYTTSANDTYTLTYTFSDGCPQIIDSVEVVGCCTPELLLSVGGSGLTSSYDCDNVYLGFVTLLNMVPNCECSNNSVTITYNYSITSNSNVVSSGTNTHTVFVGVNELPMPSDLCLFSQFDTNTLTIDVISYTGTPCIFSDNINFQNVTYNLNVTQQDLDDCGC